MRKGKNLKRNWSVQDILFEILYIGCGSVQVDVTYRWWYTICICKMHALSHMLQFHRPQKWGQEFWTSADVKLKSIWLNSSVFSDIKLVHGRSSWHELTIIRARNPSTLHIRRDVCSILHSFPSYWFQCQFNLSPKKDVVMVVINN